MGVNQENCGETCCNEPVDEPVEILDRHEPVVKGVTPPLKLSFVLVVVVCVSVSCVFVLECVQKYFGDEKPRET